MRVLQGLFLIFSICAIFYVLLFMGAAFGGAGHGTLFFAAALFAPFNMLGDLTQPEVYYCLWPGVGILLALRSFSICRIAVIALLAVHYLGVVFLCLTTPSSEWYYVGKVWSSTNGFIVMFFGGYLAAQMFIWMLILQVTRKDHDDASIPVL